MAKKIYRVANRGLDVHITPVLEENLLEVRLQEFRPTRILFPAAAESHFAHPTEVFRTEGVDLHV